MHSSSQPGLPADLPLCQPVPAPPPFRMLVCESLPSTNTFLKRHAARFPHYTAVRAVSQTAGRGRFQRAWHSAPGQDLCLSVKLPLDRIPSRARPVLAPAAALAVCRALAAAGLRPAIKWPNDVLVDDRKICGLLCEIAGEDALIAGFGVNLNSTAADLAGVGQPAISLAALTGQPADINAFAFRLLAELGGVFRTLETAGFAALRPLVEALLAYRGRRLRLTVPGRNHAGRIAGLDDAGALLFDCETCGRLAAADGTLAVLENQPDPPPGCQPATPPAGAGACPFSRATAPQPPAAGSKPRDTGPGH